MIQDIEYCKCEKPSCVYSETNDWGYWLQCSDCNKPIEDNFEYFDNQEDITMNLLNKYMII